MSRSPQLPDGTPTVALFPTLRFAFQLAWQASPALLLCLVMLTVLNGVIPPLLLQVNATLLNLIVGALTTSSSHASSGLTQSVIVLLLQLGGLMIGRQLVMLLQQSIQTVYQNKVVMVIQLRLAEHASQLDLAFFENPVFNNQLTNANNEASFRPVTIVNQFLTIGSSLITVVWVTVLVWQWHWWIVLLIVLISGLRYWVGARQGKVHATLTLAQTPLRRTAQYLNTVLTGDFFAKEVRLFDLSTWLLSRYHRVQDTLYQQSRRSELRLLVVELLVQPVLIVYLPLLTGYAILQVLQRVISVGQFSLYNGAANQLDGGCLTIITQGAQLYENLLFFRNLVSFLQVAPEIERRQPDARWVSQSVKVGGRVPTIDFCDVTFQYPDTPTPVLDHLTFHLTPGETVALVGMNGAGKTTVVKLLTGLYQPTGGRILVDGVDITTLDRRVLRALLSVIFQDYAVYHLSAADNIAVGDIAFSEDRRRIERAAERSGFASVVQRFSEGYETVLGRFIERGAELSGGQRQLLALARALMRDAPVLILDEPGAALDVEKEEAFFEKLLSTQRNLKQTIIFISHRFSTVKRADHILVLEGGRLLEEGTHEALMRKDGRYAHLFAKQMSMYAYVNEPASPDKPFPPEPFIGKTGFPQALSGSEVGTRRLFRDPRPFPWLDVGTTPLPIVNSQLPWQKPSESDYEHSQWAFVTQVPFDEGERLYEP